MRIADTQTVKQLDHDAIVGRGVPSLDLMERAATAVAEAVKALVPRGGTSAPRVAVLCGAGNNGGDGLAAARLLREAGLAVDVLLLGAPQKMTPDAAAMAARLEGAGGGLTPYTPAAWAEALEGAAVAVDALFGVGLARPLAGEYLAAVQALNARALPVVACDLPSGLDGDSGRALGAAVQADVTVTFSCAKPGLYRADGPAAAGRVVVADIGIPRDLLDAAAPDMPSLQGVRHFIWDFDGTLFDTYPITIQNLQSALAAYGQSATAADIMRRMLDTLSAACNHYADRFGIPRAALTARFEEEVQAAVARLEAPPMPDVPQVLQKIVAGGRHNYLFTHRPLTETRAYLQKHGLEGLFTELVGPENGFAAKPSPEAVLYLKQKYGMTAADAVMLGDREIDLGSGRAAGLGVIHIPCALAPETLACDWRFTAFWQMLALL